MRTIETRQWLGVAAAAVTALFFGFARPAQATIPSISNVPGATLLLPYFEVDLANTGGRTTRLWVNNSSATAVLAHVTIWTDLAVPVFQFNIYLTGYDMQKIDMRNILAGILPQTASAGQDGNDTISPKGLFSQDINFASCTGVLPAAPLSPSVVTGLRNALTGFASSLLGGQCGGRSSPGLARGYLTIDPVTNCTARFPSDSGYIADGGTGDMTNQNVLWGDYLYTHSNASSAGHGAPLVAIEASATNPLTSSGSGKYTFYGRYVAWGAADNREPLATTFAVRYVRNVTSAIVWRDPKVHEGPFACSTMPDWYPLGREHLAVFDEQEHVTVRADSPTSPTFVGNSFPAATQKVLIGSSAFPTPYAAGWIFMDMNTFVIPAGSNPSSDPNASQAYILTVRDILAGSFGNIGTEGGPAFRLDSASDANHFGPPLPPPPP